MVRAARAIALAVGTGCGAGYAPIAPGTAGSALGVALYVLLAPAGAAGMAGALAVLLPAGVWAARVCGARFGDHDHGRIVVDEVAGQLLALATFPPSAGWLLAGFLAFRVLDIVKPFPARTIDRRWRTATGVMADDLVAGLYANLVLQAARLALGP